MLALMTCRQPSSLDLDTEAMEATEDTEGTEDTVEASGEDTVLITVLEAMNIIVSEALEDSEDIEEVTARRSTLANSKHNLSILANKEFKLSFYIEVQDGN